MTPLHSLAWLALLTVGALLGFCLGRIAERERWQETARWWAERESERDPVKQAWRDSMLYGTGFMRVEWADREELKKQYPDARVSGGLENV